MRVLRFLGPETRLGWLLAFANLALAVAQFAEPVLFGRIIDALIGAQAARAAPAWTALAPLLAAWVGFGLFTIVCSTVVALYADRLAHRRRQAGADRAISSTFFNCRSAYHGGTHSGRLMKVMLQGTDALWGMWLGFFREHFAAFVSLFVLLPLALYLNWRLAILLVVLVLRLRRADHARGAQDADACRAGRGPLLRPRRARLRRARQCRAGAELHPHRGRGHRAAQRRRPAARRADAGVVLVGDRGGADARLHHHHHPGDLPGRHLAASAGPGHRRRDGDVREFRRHADHPARAGGRLRQHACSWKCRGCANSSRCSTPCRRVRDRPDAIDPGRRARAGRVRERLVLL